eukprot:jgi/Bigna1/91963/estExt_fgenesh1_pg.C_1380012
MMATTRPTRSTSPLLLSSVALTACMGLVGTMLVAGSSKAHPNLGRSMVGPARAGFAARSATQNFFPSLISNRLPLNSKNPSTLFNSADNCRSMRVNADFMPPPVSETTQKFHGSFKHPLPMIYSSFVSRLITEQHFVRYNRKYEYNPVFALGVCSVFDQVFESLGEDKKQQLFEGYIGALAETPATYRADQASLEEWAKSKSAADIAPKADGDQFEKILAGISENSENFLYSKFFSIGLFRMLELTGAKDPKALENLVTSLNLRMEPVIRDLNYYKSSLSALITAQELKKEAEARNRKKMEEAMAKKSEAIKKMANRKM